MGDRATKTRNYTDATDFPEEIDARVAVMQYCDEVENLPAGCFSIRKFQGGGHVVFINQEPYGWLRMES